MFAMTKATDYFSSQRFSLKTLVSTVALVGLMSSFTFSLSAGPVQSCEDQGMATWVFRSGILVSNGPTMSDLCLEAWNDFAHRQSADGFYRPTQGSFWGYFQGWPQQIQTYRCETCTLGLVSAPAEPSVYSFDMPSAGQIAGETTGGDVVKIERHDRFEGLKQSVYLVDVRTDKGKVQVMVDGLTGAATLIGLDGVEGENVSEER